MKTIKIFRNILFFFILVLTMYSALAFPLLNVKFDNGNYTFDVIYANAFLCNDNTTSCFPFNITNGSTTIINQTIYVNQTINETIIINQTINITINQSVENPYNDSWINDTFYFKSNPEQFVSDVNNSPGSTFIRNNIVGTNYVGITKNFSNDFSNIFCMLDTDSSSPLYWGAIICSIYNRSSFTTTNFLKFTPYEAIYNGSNICTQSNGFCNETSRINAVNTTVNIQGLGFETLVNLENDFSPLWSMSTDDNFLSDGIPAGGLSYLTTSFTFRMPGCNNTQAWSDNQELGYVNCIDIATASMLNPYIKNNTDVKFKSLTVTGTSTLNATYYNTGQTPSVTNCGSSPSITGNNMRGKIIIGSGTITSCTINFNPAWNSQPYCTAETNTSALGDAISTLNTTTLIVTTSASHSGGTLYYLCEG